MGAFGVLAGGCPFGWWGIGLWSWLLCWGFAASGSGSVGWGAEKAQGFYLVSQF